MTVKENAGCKGTNYLLVQVACKVCCDKFLQAKHYALICLVLVVLMLLLSCIWQSNSAQLTRVVLTQFREGSFHFTLLSTTKLINQRIKLLE